MDFLPFLQLASITGVWGISFILFLVPGTIAALSASGSAQQKRVVGLVVGVVCCSVLIF
jgi:apolipoprotein N-acyltransferase